MPYANYFKAYALVKKGKFADARFVLVKLAQQVKEWPKLDELNYLLTYAQLKDFQYIESQTTIKSIKDNELSKKAEDLFYYTYASDTDIKRSKETQLILKKDKEIATILAHKISGNKDTASIFLLKYLVQDYKLNPDEFGMRVSKKKEIYTVALLLPFSLNNPRAFLNTPSLNIKDGVEFAIDSLKKMGVKIELKLFDTEKSKSRVSQILGSDGFKEVDLILGPVSGEACIEVAKFCATNKIVNFNFSREDAAFGQGSHVYSLRTSYSETGKQLANCAKTYFDSTLNVKIFYYKADKNDSVLAYAYKKNLELLKVRVASIKGFGAKDMEDFKKALSAVKDQETSHVMIFGDNNLFASNAISIWESENKTTTLVVQKDWLDIQLITYEQFMRKNIHFVYNDYIYATDQAQYHVNKKYATIYGVKPSNLGYLAMGYDVMLFTGSLLQKYGNQFNKTFSKSVYQDLPLTAGVDLSTSKTNAIIPVLKLDENYEFIWVNKPKK
jgi:ABC-type branched-subunit amino acid transport system substrate-binding protein